MGKGDAAGHRPRGAPSFVSLAALDENDSGLRRGGDTGWKPSGAVGGYKKGGIISGDPSEKQE